MRIFLGAVSCALALAAASTSGHADGALNSLSDLDGGAQSWHAIAPNGSADKKPADPVANVSTHPAPAPTAAASGDARRIDDNLVIETTPRPPQKPVPSLWFTQQSGSK